MASLEDQFRKACEDREIPGVVLLASDFKGTFKYAKAFGPKTPTEPMDLNATFIMASCTKLITSIAAMQCVERGLIGLDDDVSKILTELQDVEIINFKPDSKELSCRKATKKITIRHLLSHSSGFGYEGMSPQYDVWRKSRGDRVERGSYPIFKQITVPLLFEPGEGFMYGYSIDWAGILVTRLTNLSLEEYFEKEIWGPLGIKDITFHQENKDSVRKNLVKMCIRKGIKNPLRGVPARNNECVEWTDELLYPNPQLDEYGGGGCIGSPVEYMKILLSIGSNEEKLLKKETVDEMFKPQLNEAAVKQYEAFVHIPFFVDGFAGHKVYIKQNYGLGGMLVLQDEETGRRKGTLSWSGLPNLLWTIDREAGLALMYASNVTPFGDPKSGDMERLFETEMYTRFEKVKESSML